LYETICVSAGQRGLQVLVAPDDFIRVISARVAAIARDKTAR
jgi:Cys-tRNA(Pro)/Cys-tRNA(Cys) deacylase